jgi:MraZ protein
MLIGRYYHTLEEKGRVSLPKTFRENSDHWVVTRGLDGGLFLFTEADFTQQVRELEQRTFTKKSNRDYIRLMTNDAQTVSPDKNGRVQLPEYLIEFASLQKHLVIVGSLNRLEIWDRDLYHQYLDAIEPQAEAIAESLESNQ